MKLKPHKLACAAAIAFCAVALHAAPLSTLQNSTLSVPASIIAAPGVPGSTNLVGSNFLMSALSPVSSQGGHAWLHNSQQWVQRYSVGNSAATEMVTRSDGTLVVTGYSSSLATSEDFLTIAYSADGKPLWTNLYDGPAHYYDTAYYIATTPGGDVWVAGSSGRTSTNFDLTDAVLIKYSSNGLPLWTNRYSSAPTNGDYAQALTTDPSGNAYLVVGTTYWPSGGNYGTPLGNTLIKYDSTGVPLWTNRYPAHAAQGLIDVEAIALDQAANVFIAGDASDQFVSGSALVKLTTDGIPIWTNIHAWPFMSPIRSILVDHNGDAVLTGESFSTPSVVYVVMKVSAAGDSLWTNSMVGPNYDGGGVPQTLLDPAGNVLLVGGRSGAPSPGLYQILKLSANGLPLWTNLTVTLQTNNSIFDTAAMDSAGNLYLAGYAPSSGAGNLDFITMKFSGEGLALWTNWFDPGAGSGASADALAVDGTGNIYVAGQSHDVYGHELTVVKYADLMFYKPPKDFTGTDTITYTVTDYLGNQAPNNLSVLITPGEFRLSVSSPTNLTPAGLNLNLKTTPGTNTVIIETCADLINWQPILTNSGTKGSVELLDPPAANLPRRFYRAIIQGFTNGP
ncbi:MAG: hypothetical protein ACXWKG_07165 [Limisphaerales bacterium]